MWDSLLSSDSNSGVVESNRLADRVSGLERSAQMRPRHGRANCKRYCVRSCVLILALTAAVTGNHLLSSLQTCCSDRNCLCVAPSLVMSQQKTCFSSADRPPSARSVPADLRRTQQGPPEPNQRAAICIEPARCQSAAPASPPIDHDRDTVPDTQALVRSTSLPAAHSTADYRASGPTRRNRPRSSVARPRSHTAVAVYVCSRW